VSSRRGAPGLLGVAALLFVSALSACSGQEPGPFEDAVELRAFLEGRAPLPLLEEGGVRLNEAFARQAVRAYGYRKEGVGDATEDGWSPVVKQGADGAEAADITAWIEGGDIDDAGRFMPRPREEGCDAAGPFATEGLTEEEQGLENLQDRVARLTCALERLSGIEGDVEIAWTAPREVAASIGEGVIHVNPRAVHLVIPVSSRVTPPSLNEAPSLEPASEGPPAPGGDAIIVSSEPDPARSDPAIDHHPRPEPVDESDEDVCEDVCESVCGSILESLVSCEGSDSGGDSSSCEGESASSSSSGCELSGEGGRRGDRKALFLSAVALAAFALRRRRVRRAEIIALAALLVIAPIPAFAQQPKPLPKDPSAAPKPAAGAQPKPAPQAPPPRPDAKKLYQEGMQKLQEKSYAEAVGLFQSAYNASPSPEALEGIAAAQKGLLKTPHAIQTLEHMLVQFGPSLTVEKHKETTAEIERMRAELVTVQIIVTPPDATVFINDEELPPEATSGPIHLSPGTHKFSARREGFARGARSVDLSTGPKARDIELTLPPSHAFLSITAPEPDFVIAIDGTSVAQGSYAGFVVPGKHTVQMFRVGGVSHAFSIDVVAGQTLTLPNDDPPRPPAATYPSAYPSAGDVPPDGSFDPPSPAATSSATGTYVLANVSAVWGTARLYGFEDVNAVPGLAVGLRGGYRLFSPVGVEVLVEYSYSDREANLSQYFAEDKDGSGGASGSERFSDTSPARYTIQGIRVGPILRLMTTNAVNRFVISGGAGAFSQWISLDHVNIEWNDTLTKYEYRGEYHHDYQGFGLFALGEVGYERSIGDLLVGASLGLSIDGVGGIEGDPYDSSVDARIGVSLRVGYSTWKRSDARGAGAR
jgi:hypothetical protein